MIIHEKTTNEQNKHRVILNVADGRYLPYQDRLAHTLKEKCKALDHADILFWREELPPNSPTHKSSPYSFKLFAIQDALNRGYKTIIWCDTSCVGVGNLSPMVFRIEREGHFFVIGGDKLGNWTNDYALDHFGLTRDQVFTLKWQLLGGTIYGFDFTRHATATLFDKWKDCQARGMFEGAYFNSHQSTFAGDQHRKSEGFVSNDERCKGHRHDETCISFIAQSQGMKLTGLGDLFQGDKEDTVMRSNYEL